jgi:hypothetical protein
MIVGIEPIDLGALVVGALLIAGFIYWRMRQSRIDKDEKKADDIKP